MADLFSRKQLYIFSNVLLCVFFMLVFLTGNLIYLCVAWVFYGLANAVGSGTLDSQLVNDIKIEKQSLAKFFQKSQQVNIISLMIGSSAGSFLFFTIGDKIYLLSIVLCLLSILITLFFKNNQVLDKHKRATLSSHLNQTFKEIRNSKPIQVLTACTIISQVFLQTHFQLWQNYLLSFHIEKRIFFVFYIVFQLISFVVMFIPFTYLERIKKYIFIVPIF